MGFKQEHLPPGEYMCKIVDAAIEPGRKPGDLKAMLTVAVPALGDAKLKVEAASMVADSRIGDERDELITLENQRILELEVQLSKRSVSQDYIERLARVAWENTGKGDLPVLPAGHGWVDGVTRRPISEEDLVSTWEKVTSKDTFRRAAAAIAQALGFKLGADVTVTPRDLIKGAQAPMRREIAKLLVQHIVKNMERESAFLQPDPQVFMRDPYALLDLIRKEANVSAEDMDAWMLEAQKGIRGGPSA